MSLYCHYVSSSFIMQKWYVQSVKHWSMHLTECEESPLDHINKFNWRKSPALCMCGGTTFLCAYLLQRVRVFIAYRSTGELTRELTGELHLPDLCGEVRHDRRRVHCGRSSVHAHSHCLKWHVTEVVIATLHMTTYGSPLSHSLTLYGYVSLLHFTASNPFTTTLH